MKSYILYNLGLEELMHDRNIITGPDNGPDNRLKHLHIIFSDFKFDFIYLLSFFIKWFVHPKTKILSSYTHHHVTSNLYDFFLW